MSHSKKNGHMFVRASELPERKKIQAEQKARQTLAFNHCCLTFQPIQGEAVTTKDGYMFDILNLIPWVRKHKIHPITGKPLDMKDLIRLNIKLNDDGKPCCPVTDRIFTEQSHIVAIGTTGNVYSWNGIENMNLSEGEVMHDVLTNTEFTKDDIITLQDPKHPQDVKSLYHKVEQQKQAEKKRKKEDENHEPSLIEKASEYINLNSSTSKVLEEMERRQKKKKENNEEDVTYQSTSHRTSEQSYGALSSDSKASSLTSSVMNIRTKSHAIEKESEQYWKEKGEQYERIRKEFKGKKAYVSLHTNMGDLNFELYPWVCPQTCDNFISLCKSGYYNGVKFHRLIKGFMIQGGDPTGTGRGGKSIWGGEFKDEISGKLRHDSFGVLSMANRGPNTNTSQFFVMFHLNNKHTVFGKLVGGIKLLEAIENIKTDKEDRPVQDVVIESTELFYNPFAEDEKIQRERSDSQKFISTNTPQSTATPEKEQFGNWFSNPSGLKQASSGQPEKVGKYLKLSTTDSGNTSFLSKLVQNGTPTTASSAAKKNATSSQSNNQFNFSNW